MHLTLSELLQNPQRVIDLPREDRKSTRLNSSHLGISYAVFCLKKKMKEVGAEPDADDVAEAVHLAVAGGCGETERVVLVDHDLAQHRSRARAAPISEQRCRDHA